MTDSVAHSLQTQKTTWIWLIGIMLLAAFLRIYDLNSESYWLDEIIMVKITQSDLPTILQRLETGRPPLYVLLGHVWVNIFGATEAATRSLSVLAGLASIPVVFLIGSNWFNKTVGLLAALLTTVSIFHIYYSQEYRYYSVLMLFTVLTFYFYIRALQTRRTLDFALYIICAIGVFYSHAFAMFVLAAPGLHFLLQIRRYKSLLWKWLVSEIIIVLGILPGLWLLVGRMFGATQGSGGVESDPNAWIMPPTWLSPFRTILNYVFYDYHLINVIAVAIAAGILVLGVVLYLAGKSAAQRRDFIQGATADIRATLSNTSHLLLLVLWVALPIVIPLLLSMLNILGSTYLDRYLSTAAPALFLLLGVVFVSLRKVAPIALVLLAFGVMIAPSLYTYYNDDIKEQWRELAITVAAETQPQDTVVVAYADFPEYRMDVHDSFFWYYPESSAGCYIDMKLDNPDLIGQLTTCNPGSERYWIVIHGDNPSRMQTLDEYLTTNQLGALLTTQKFLGTSAYLFQIASAGQA